MSYGVCPSAATLAAYVLGQTERIAVGTAWGDVLSTAASSGARRRGPRRWTRCRGGGSGWAWAAAGLWVDLEVFGTGLGRYESGFAEGLRLPPAAPISDRVRGTGLWPLHSGR